MLFKYQTIDKEGTPSEGTIEAANVDVAVTSLQRRGLVISSIVNAEQKNIFTAGIESYFERISNKDIVILSRQMSTLFTAQISALRIFKMLASEAPKMTMRTHLGEIVDDLQGGSSISKALSKHPKMFSEFYVSMVRAGEEAGKLDQTFNYLADYLDRSYEVSSKARNALIYPAFVIFTAVAVMVLMMTVVIPKLGEIMASSGQAMPVYTQIVVDTSSIFVHYGFIMLAVVIALGAWLWFYSRKPAGRLMLSHLKLSVPYLGTLYTKLYLSRISDNLNIMLQSAIPIVRALEITGSVVDNAEYELILKEVTESVRTGTPLSEAMGRYPERIPGILVQMIKVGEESGEVGSILKTLGMFYDREVINAVDTLIGLIEPAMIIFLGLGVGFLLMSVLVPIYNISSSIQ